MRIYGDRRSGNCYKLVLLLHLLQREYEWTDVDIMKGETQNPAFLALSANGKIPIIELPDGRVLAESNAILYFLDDKAIFTPASRYDFAKMLEWQNFEQYSHEPAIAVARFIKVYLGLPASRRDEYEKKVAAGYRALEVMEQHLTSHRFFVSDRPTLADISLFAYTSVAHEGGFDLAAFPAVRHWLERISALPGFVPLGH
ncbi:glutathione S-transferase family protein [Alteromonas sp. CYL-A6]|uniref:glutathione S-transferase family protein n=1 Tax=Alteromonas nitratireducens TaxID=3390813 RepID=UPI0034B53503